MGACLSQRKVDVNKKDAVVIFQPEFQTEDDSSSSVDVIKNPCESLDSDLIDMIIKKNPSLLKPKNVNSSEFKDWMSNTNFPREVDTSEERTTPSTRTSNKIYLSSIMEPSITNSLKKTLPASVYRRTDFNRENSYQSNDGGYRLATGDNSQTCSLSNKHDEASETDSASFGVLGNTLSFDGLNMRSTNRHDIGMAMLKAQIEHGADPSRITTHGGRTALMFSALAKDLNFTKKLVGLGVDLNKRNDLGETALSLAREAHNEDIVNYLRSQGALDKVAE